MNDKKEIKELEKYIKKQLVSGCANMVGDINTEAIRKNFGDTISLINAHMPTRILVPKEWYEVAQLVKNKNDDKLIELIGDSDSEYIKIIRLHTESLSDKVKEALDLAEIVEK